nr:uncharacterized protein LOC118973221 [Manis javanica]
MEAARCPEGRLAKAPARAAPERTGQTRCHRGVWVRPGGRRLNTETQNNHQNKSRFYLPAKPAGTFGTFICGILAPSACSDCFRARLQPSKENGRAAGFPPGWICPQDLGVDSGVGLSFKVGVTKCNQIRGPDVKGKCIRIPLKKGEGLRNFCLKGCHGVWQQLPPDLVGSCLKSAQGPADCQLEFPEVRSTEDARGSLGQKFSGQLFPITQLDGLRGALGHDPGWKKGLKTGLPYRTFKSQGLGVRRYPKATGPCRAWAESFHVE